MAKTYTAGMLMSIAAGWAGVPFWIGSPLMVPPFSKAFLALKQALQKHAQAWIAKYASYIESELLESICEDLEAQMQLLTDNT